MGNYRRKPLMRKPSIFTGKSIIVCMTNSKSTAHISTK